ncbi:cysteine desulfurase NifS [Candidatus Pacearchaeota archaeon CG_4_9_14_0_2_um_filter_39_13]|nr:cysteine desulfurase [Candidatus Pacearchaeota archaeon]OIO42952.1 MAG: hypothetical protein AUJ64_03200 [Candidatus Pacearchaeota archaeon CG1_02_39_14]PJC44982.1 MAG: cysteine desulfurase NifS [Candidatus Pacearchaeota archaeon CG_4_9_14_0_2_um_filter_39_13]
MKEVYLDYAATTPVYPEVVKVVNRFMEKDYGNPGSLHDKGQQALKAISEARKRIALEIGCRPEEVIFTSGATEANNIALRCSGRKKILVSAIEHPSVMETAKNWAGKLVIIPVDENGFVDTGFIEKEADENSLVSVMHVNNIFGTIQDIDEIGKICRKKKALFHTDAVQSFGKVNFGNSFDLLSASAHKIGGPKGIGILVAKKNAKLDPWTYGGGQEFGLRSGTENVPGIMGFAKALEMQKKADWRKIERLRDKLIEGLEKLGSKINGSKDKRIWNNIHFSFPGRESEETVLALSLKGLYVSTGSACDSKKTEEYVLKAIGLKKDEIESGIRITLGWKTKEEHVDLLLKELRKILLG